MKEGLPNHTTHMGSIRKVVSKRSSRCGATAIETKGRSCHRSLGRSSRDTGHEG